MFNERGAPYRDHQRVRSADRQYSTVQVEDVLINKISRHDRDVYRAAIMTKGTDQ
jgi:hypothetical protein